MASTEHFDVLCAEAEALGERVRLDDYQAYVSIMDAVGEARAEVEALATDNAGMVQFVQYARPLLGLSGRGSLGAQADALLGIAEARRNAGSSPLNSPSAPERPSGDPGTIER